MFCKLQHIIMLYAYYVLCLCAVYILRLKLFSFAKPVLYTLIFQVF